MQKKNVLLKIITFSLFVGSGCFGFAYLSNFFSKIHPESASAATAPVGQTGYWRPVFEENFDGTSVDASRWDSCIYWGFGDPVCIENSDNDEWYKSANSTVSNGTLSIQAKSEDATLSGKTYHYSSGLIASDRGGDITSGKPKFEFQYGYVEMRAKIPAGKGLWPAFWLLPSDHEADHEIDIMEILGDNPKKTYMTYHYDAIENGVTVSKSVDNSWSIPNETDLDFSEDYHTYAVDWNPNYIAWYVDGVERFRITDQDAILPNEPMFIIANLQVGTDSSWPKAPDQFTKFPANYDIDYIRVWTKRTARIPVPITNLIQNASFETASKPWFLDVRSGAAATFVQDNATATSGSKSAVVNTTQNSSTDWHVQFAQSNLPMIANKKYTIQFMAKAETPRNVPLVLQKTNSPYTEYVHQDIALTTEWKKYTLTYTSTVSEIDNKLSFSLGANTGKVWIDEVLFRW